MTTFRYKGQTAGGAKVSGVLRAYDEFEAADKLRESVAIITKLEAVPEKKESVLSRPVAFRVKEKELALLCSQFAIILASGLSVERCVSMVAAQTKNKYLRRMLDKVSEEVGAGYSLAQSFGNNAPYLPKTFTETLRAGEQSGTLESCFQRLHAYYDRSAKTRAKIVSTLTYPVMVIIVAIVVFVIIIAVAVPAFTDAFTDLGSGSLPGVTRALMAVSAFFTKWWWLTAGSCPWTPSTAGPRTSPSRCMPTRPSPPCVKRRTAAKALPTPSPYPWTGWMMSPPSLPWRPITTSPSSCTWPTAATVTAAWC